MKFCSPGLGLTLWLCAAGCAAQPAPISFFPNPEALPAQTALPDPLLGSDGQRITTRGAWIGKRRPELQALFERYEYGALPPKPSQQRFELLSEHRDFLGGQATLKLINLITGSDSNAPRIGLMLVVPNNPGRPAPVFLAMNFCGNHSLTRDPRVPLSTRWMGKGCAGCSDNLATEAARGTQATNWPLAEIIARGYALAAFYSGDVDPDRADVSEGIYQWLANGEANRNNPTNRGTIAAWAWGFHRCVDYLQTDRAVDKRRIAAVGHSRNGKTAILAAALDERITMVFAHQAGCGGTAPSRSQTGESVKAINDRFPHWFNGEFKKFNAAPERLPFDQHCLVALCAPRPILISAAQEDQWSNPAGQFAMARAASPVYELLGSRGLAATEMPPVRQLVDSPIGYYIREGRHSMTSDDWRVFLNFADRHWPR